jgi:uncharacterized iron-regulated membrane protein
VATSNGSKLIQVGVAAVVILATTITLLGINGQVASLQDQVHELQDQQVLIDENAEAIATLQEQVAQVARFRDDILLAVCIANARGNADASRCRRAASNVLGPSGDSFGNGS